MKHLFLFKLTKENKEKMVSVEARIYRDAIVQLETLIKRGYIAELEEITKGNDGHKELVVTLYIGEYTNHAESHFDDGTVAYLSDWEEEETDLEAEPVSDIYTPLKEWVEDRFKTIHEAGDFLIEERGGLDIQTTRVVGRKINGAWYVND